MRKFIALYSGNVSDAEKAALTQTDLQPKIAAWGEWVRKYSKQIVDNGGPCGKTKRVDNKGAHDSKNMVGAYVIVEAESYDDAAKMFVGHPHLSFFKDNWIEIMECLALPRA